MSLLLGCVYYRPMLAQPLPIGAQMPPLIFDKIYNHENKPLSLADLKGKFVVFDFWNTYCSGCISGLHKFDSLQKIVKDKLYVIAVTREKSDVVSRFWSHNKYLVGIKIPTIIEDTLLHSFFPHSGVPHLVWIDPQGKILHTTNSEYETLADIQRLLNGQSQHWVNAGLTRHPDYHKPLFDYDTVKNKTFGGFYSVLMPYRPEMRTSYHIIRDTLTQQLKITCINANVLGLYTTAFKFLFNNLPENRLKIHVKDPSKLRYDPANGNRNDWNLENTRCYECVIPLSRARDSAMVFDRIRSDLDLLLGYHSKIKNESADYFEIVDTEPSRRKSLVGAFSAKWMTLSDFLDGLKYQENLPIICLGQNIDPNWRMAPDDSYLFTIERLAAYLFANGLKLEKKSGYMDFFSLTDAP
ncbi:Thiol-disulfide isomerase or thioredoxin [bacterium A37T11]|nr:Thiol-disulfide isomerase or thioredoxin [bacterium A37T11]